MIKEITVGKEISEVADLLALIVKEIKAKKGVAEIAASALPALILAVNGYDQLAVEVKSEDGINSLLYAAAEIAKALKG